MKAYSFELMQNAWPWELTTPRTLCGASGCATDLSREKQYYKEIAQTDQQPAPSFNYFCTGCGEKARRNLKFY